jgi:uncharacterized protein
MTGAAALDLAPEHRQIVLNILAANLPPNSAVWVFGSRASGRARRYSDLDLAIDAGRRLTLDDFARLTEAFGDSDLPFKVDVVDWLAIDDRFRRLIAERRVALAGGSASAPARDPSSDAGTPAI